MSKMDQVLESLASSDSEIIREGAKMAGADKLVEAVPALIKHLENTHIGVQEAVDRALRKIGGASVVRGVIPYLRSEKAPNRNLAMDLLRHLGSADIDALHALLHDADSDIRIFGADILGSVNSERAVPFLSQVLLHDPEVNVRYQAAVSLGQLAFVSAAQSLNQALGDEEWVQFSAIEALTKIRDESSVDFLLKALGRSTDLIASTIIDALGEMGNLKAVPILLKRMTSSPVILSNKIVRAIMSILGEKSLGLLGDSERNKLSAYMAAALKDEDAEVQDAAIRGLAAFGHVEAAKDIIEIAAALDPERHTERLNFIVESLTRLGLNKGLEKAVKEGSDAVKDVALAVLARLFDPAVPQLLVTLFWENSRDVQRVMCQVLAGCSSPDEQGFFLDILKKHEDGTVLRSALTFLGKYGEAKTVEASVMTFLAHPYNDVKETALEACIDLDTQTIRDHFKALSADDDIINKMMAVYALGRFDSDGYLPELKAALQCSSPEVVEVAINALGHKKPVTAERISLAEEMLHNENSALRKAAVDVLGECPSALIGEKLLACLNDPDPWVVVRCTEKLGERGSPKIIEHLIGLLHHENRIVVLKVIEILGKQGGVVAFRALLSLLDSSDEELQQAAEAAADTIRRQSGE